MKIEIPEYVQYALSALENNGFEAFIVGGAVRDAVIGNEVHDYDITTSASPHECISVFSHDKIISTGIKHGTVTLVRDGSQTEITTYRIDGTYDDNRHPTEVSFSKSLKDDLARRDFTINAMAYSERTGIVDIFGGIKDTGNKLIRTVGDPIKRFSEDSLRILRALRFSATLGFDIEDKTSDAVFALKDSLANISSERIKAEYDRILVGRFCVDVLRRYRDVFAVFMPEIAASFDFNQHNGHHRYDVFEHTLHAIDAAPPDISVRYALLFHDLGKPHCYSVDSDGNGHFFSHENVSSEIADRICRRLKFDNAAREKICTLVKYHGVQTEETGRAVKRLMCKIGKDMFRPLIDVKIADTIGQGVHPERLEHFRHLLAIYDEIIKKDECFSVRSLAVNGNDVQALGFRGKEIGEALNLALEKVIDGEIKNDKNEIEEFLCGQKKYS